MFRIIKRLEVSGSHHLNLPYESKCSRDHGHNWIIQIYCWATDDEVDSNNGMVVDFTYIKKKIHDVLDHKCLNEIEGLGFEKQLSPAKNLNPTAENIARWICHQIPQCYKVKVQESEGNVAIYTDEWFLVERKL